MSWSVVQPVLTAYHYSILYRQVCATEKNIVNYYYKSETKSHTIDQKPEPYSVLPTFYTLVILTNFANSLIINVPK